MADSEDRLLYSLRVGSLDVGELVVTSFRGTENLGGASWFDIEAADSDQTRFLALEDLVGQPATLTFTPPHGQERTFHGIAMAVDALGMREGRPRYVLRLEPALARLGVGKRSRVYQARSAVEIVTAILGDAGLTMRNDLTGSYQARELCVQFDESDLHFVWRLLESEGIHAYLEHGESEATFVLSDGISGGPDSGAVLPFRPPTGAVTIEEHAAAVSFRHVLRPDSTVTRDFNPLQPGLNLEGTAEAPDAGDDIEFYEQPGGYGAPAGGKARARRLLDELAGDRRLCKLRTDSARLQPGYAFELTEHPELDFNGKLTALSVSHFGDDRRYVNEVAALPNGVAWRPPRATSRPFVAGVQTAMVIGPDGEEIYTDQHGRVKVRFHWERGSDGGDAGSCWLRTSQSWAGAGMGALFIPRVGHEVIVRFMEGDPDRPIVIGSVYNGAAAPPASLPDQKTQSTVRSSSTPGGNGANELRFEDASGNEEIYLHAQKDEKIVVEHDKQQQVVHDETLVVEKNRSRTVDQNQTLVVDGHDSTVVEKNQTLTVQQNRTTQTRGDNLEDVEGDQKVTVGGTHLLVAPAGSQETIGGGKNIAVGGAMTLTVASGASIEVGARIARAVAGAHKSIIGGSLTSGVDGDVKSDTGGKLVVDVDGDTVITAGKEDKLEIGGSDAEHVEAILSVGGKTVQMKAEKLTFSVDGKLLLDMAQSGALKLNASTLTIESSGEIKTKGSKIDKTSSGSAPSASVSPPKPDTLDPATVRRAKLVSVQMSSPDGAPVAGLVFEARLPDGTVKRGRLSGDGSAALPAPDSGDVQITFPDLDAAEWDVE